MNTVKLKVTSKVLRQSKNDENQRQIAINDPTGSAKVAILSANRNNKIGIRFAGALTLNVGDNSAIWSSHNKEHDVDFNSLFDFLSKHPDVEFHFICSLEE